ncbi:MAG: hypothetical protein ABIJ42_01725, partial [Acidobacteriota bacterium]
MKKNLRRNHLQEPRTRKADHQTCRKRIEKTIGGMHGFWNSERIIDMLTVGIPDCRALIATYHRNVSQR